MVTDERFENFIEDDDWFSTMETKVLDLEKELCEWRESRTREPAEPARRREREPEETAYPRGRQREFLRVTARPEHGRDHGRSSADRTPAGRSSAGRAPVSRSPAGRRRPAPAPGPAWAVLEDEPRHATDRTQALIDRGRRTTRKPRSRRGRKVAIGSAAGMVALVIGALIVLRHGPSWPPSVATVQSEITTACQNPNVVSEPSQVNFACGKDTSQILWVFALLTSNDNSGYADAKAGRKGLEPITPVQGGEIAWSLNLHHPYNPSNPVDSLEVAARAINNIIGGATLTGANGSPAVQPGLESKPENCARYTGSSAIISHAGFPSLCASPVTSPEGQAALVADVYQQWMPTATSMAAQNVSVLFQNANNPGDPQVQAILKTLPNPAG